MNELSPTDWYLPTGTEDVHMNHMNSKYWKSTCVFKVGVANE